MRPSLNYGCWIPYYYLKIVIRSIKVPRIGLMERQRCWHSWWSRLTEEGPHLVQGSPDRLQQQWPEISGGGICLPGKFGTDFGVRRPSQGSSMLGGPSGPGCGGRFGWWRSRSASAWPSRQSFRWSLTSCPILWSPPSPWPTLHRWITYISSLRLTKKTQILLPLLLELAYFI